MGATGGLTAEPERFLAEHGGLHTPVLSQAQAEEKLAAARAETQRRSYADSLPVTAAAELLGVTVDSVRRQAEMKQLVTFRIGDELRVPRWQLTPAGAIPYLPLVLAALPKNLHHNSIEGFMTTRKDELDGMSAIQRLSAGGDPQPVTELAHWLDWD